MSVFGGAGAQHACDMAKKLGIKKIFVHQYAGILSAYGLALADVVEDISEPANWYLNNETLMQAENLFS